MLFRLSIPNLNMSLDLMRIDLFHCQMVVGLEYVLIFEVDNSSVYADNRKKDILIL